VPNRERDPLADLQENSLTEGKEGGQLTMMKLAPNFEMALYLAQATGACIVTDSRFRWKELTLAIRQRPGNGYRGLDALRQCIERSGFAFPNAVADILALHRRDTFVSYPAVMRDSFRYLSKLDDRGPKPNREAHLAASFAKTHVAAQAAIKKAGVAANHGRISCAFPPGGIQDNTVNRLLLMSSSEQHLLSVPMAFFVAGS
jgi:hypothetical protein